MNPIEMLKADHRRVEQLFQQFQNAPSPQQKKQLGDQLLRELEVHSKLEEQVFYPMVQQRASGQLDQTVEHGYEDHARVDRLLVELKRLTSVDERYEMKMQQLMQDVQDHVEEEESGLLPRAEQILGSQMQQLGQQMQQRKQELMSSVR